MPRALWLGTKLTGAGLSAYLAQQVPNALRTGMQQAASRAMFYVHNDVLTKSLSGKVHRKGLFYVSDPGNQIAARTGETKHHVTMESFSRGSSVFAVVGSPDKHVLMNEVGGDVHPRNAKSLAVPTANIMSPTGRLKDKWAGLLANNGWRGVDWKKERLFIYRGKWGSPKGGGWIAQAVYKGGSTAPKRGKGGRMKSTGSIVLLAKLVSVVHLAARHMFKASAARVSTPVAAMFNEAVSIAVQTRVK